MRPFRNRETYLSRTMLTTDRYKHNVIDLVRTLASVN